MFACWPNQKFVNNHSSEIRNSKTNYRQARRRHPWCVHVLLVSNLWVIDRTPPSLIVADTMLVFVTSSRKKTMGSVLNDKSTYFIMISKEALGRTSRARRFLCCRLLACASLAYEETSKLQTFVYIFISDYWCLTLGFIPAIIKPRN